MAWPCIVEPMQRMKRHGSLHNSSREKRQAEMKCVRGHLFTIPRPAVLSCFSYFRVMGLISCIYMYIFGGESLHTGDKRETEIRQSPGNTLQLVPALSSGCMLCNQDAMNCLAYYYTGLLDAAWLANPLNNTIAHYFNVHDLLHCQSQPPVIYARVVSTLAVGACS